MMNTILIPTDFSEVAANALRTAKLIAKKTNAVLHLAHFYSLPIADYTYPDINMPAEILEQLRKDAKEGIAEATKALTEEGFTVESTIEMGMVTDEVVSLAGKINADLIVMGTTGANSIINKVIGSNAASVMQRTANPILLVPKDCTCDSFSNIVYLDELKEDDTEVLSKVFAFGNEMGAVSIKILNVNTGFFFKPVNEHLMMQLDRAFGLEKIKLETADGADLQEGIEHYLESHLVNLLVMSTHKKSFLERLFVKNDTVKVAQYSKVPLLVYHKS